MQLNEKMSLLVFQWLYWKQTPVPICALKVTKCQDSIWVVDSLETPSTVAMGTDINAAYRRVNSARVNLRKRVS